METGSRFTVGVVLCMLLSLTYLLVLSNVEQSGDGQFYLPPYKKAPIPAQQPSEPPEPEWEDPGPYHVAYPRNYRFIMDDTTVCRDSKPFALLLVPVAPADLTARNIIRSSWGQSGEVQGQLVQTLFFVGVPTGAGSEHLQEQLKQENEQHHDLIQSNFMDSYRNLTIKTMIMLEWLSAHCSTAAMYAVKVDSDMFLHVPNLVKLLLWPDTPKSGYMTGLVWWRSPVLRNPGNKFYMPPDVIAEPVYPPYPLGMTYVLSLDLPRRILEVSRQIKPIYIEDAYLGMCLKELQLAPTNPPRGDMFLVNPRHPLSPCALANVIATTTTSTPQMMSYWRRSQQSETHC